MPGSSTSPLPATMYGSSCDFQADPVPGPVEERLAVPGRGDRLARGRVDRLRGHPRPHRGARRLLGVVQHLVVGGELGGRLADRVGAGAVRAVPRRHRAADVHHHRVAGFQDPVRDLVVRAGGVGPGGHDHEVHRGVPLGQDGLGDVRADLALGPPGPQPARDAGVHPVDGLARLAQRRDLGRTLPDPQRAQRAAGQRQARADGSTSRNLSTNSAHIRSDRPTAETLPSRPATRRNGSAVSSQGMISRPSEPAGEACAAGSSSRGTNSAGSPCAGTARQVRRSSCLAS